MENHKGFLKSQSSPSKLGTGATVNGWSLMEAVATGLLIPTHWPLLTLCWQLLEIQVKLSCPSQIRREKDSGC